MGEWKMYNKSIGPHDELPIGTKVRVGNKYGKVIKVRTAQAHPSGNICVHTIEFEKAIRRGVGSRTSKPIPMRTPLIKEVNYSFIQLVGDSNDYAKRDTAA